MSGDSALCAITGCRIRNSHLPDCDDDDCAGCLPRTAHEGHTCDACISRTASRLGTIAELAPDAALVAAGLVRRGDGHASGKPESRSPLNDAATDDLDEVRNALTTIARDIAETRGLQTPSAPQGGRGAVETIAVTANWLSGHLGWIRHAADDQGGPYAVTVFAEIGECASKMRAIVNGPSARRFMGPCGITLCSLCGQVEENHVCEGDIPVWICEGDVYARDGARTGTCRTCGHRVATDERRAWLDDEVRQHAYRAAHIADAYGLSADTIRSWALRGKLRSYWRTEAGLTIEWVDPVLDDTLTGEAMRKRLGDISDEIQARGGRLHYVGDVLDLAAAVAARRGTEQAKRARRAAARESAEMGA